MIETCNCCTPASENFEKKLEEYRNLAPETRKLLAINSLEAIGQAFGCGEQRLVCEPLKKLAIYGTRK